MSKTLVEAITKEEKVSKKSLKIKQGCFVIPIAEEKICGEGTLMTQIRKKGYCGVVLAVYDDPHSSNQRVTVRFTQSDLSNVESAFTYTSVNLKVISEEEANKILSEMEEGMKNTVKEIEKKLKEITNIKRIPRSKRNDFELTEKEFLNTNYNFIKLCGHVSEDGTISGSVSNYVNATCCSLTKTQCHIVVHIPVSWLNYFGYSIIDLKRWIRFLKDCDIDFDGIYAGKATLGSEFGKSSINTSIPRFAANNVYINPDMECYKLIIKAPSGTSNMQQYMRFLLVRYIYNHQYWNIPLIAMQIKDALKSKITSWEALLVAHMNHDYYGYYALCANSINPYGRKAYAIPSSNNSQKNVLSKLSSGPSMNSSLIYTDFSEDVRSMIKSKDYNSILKFVQDCRKK